LEESIYARAQLAHRVAGVYFLIGLYSFWRYRRSRFRCPSMKASALS